MEIIAHRGASHDAPENTLPAIMRAWRQGADGVEIDIRQTADGELIVFHDSDFRRIGGSAQRVAAIHRPQLARLDAGIHRGQRWKRVRVPYLVEILPTIPRGRRLWLELKGADRLMLDRLEQVLSATRTAPERVVIIGFSRRMMEAARRRFAAIPILLNVAFRKSKEGWWPTADALQAWASKRHVAGLHLQARPGLRATIRQLKTAGFSVYCWTVDDPAYAVQLRRAGCDGVTTNRPGWLRRALAQTS